jgi:hypothetical protein
VNFLARVDRLADRELVRGDDALALVSDVDEDLVLVDANHGPRDDVPFLEKDHRRVVVGHDATVDLEQQTLRALYDMGFGCGWRGHGGFHRQRITLATCAMGAASAASL